MRITNLMMGVALIGMAAAAGAQTKPAAPAAASESPDAPRTPLPYDRGYDKPSARTEAINAEIRPQVAAANNAVAAATAGKPTLSVSAEDQARYETDMAAYRSAVAAQNRAAAADAELAARQERAYADAMFAWRLQVANCDRGIKRACLAPSPNPADYW